jgi:hypothetical protein
MPDFAFRGAGRPRAGGDAGLAGHDRRSPCRRRADRHGRRALADLRGYSAALKRQPGDAVELTVRRDGEEKVLRDAAAVTGDAERRWGPVRGRSQGGIGRGYALHLPAAAYRHGSSRFSAGVPGTTAHLP